MTIRRFPQYIFPLLIFTFHSPTVEAAPAKEGAEGEIVALLKPLIALVSKNPWIQGVGIILVTFIAASLVTWMLFKLLRKMLGSTRIALDERVVLMLRPPIYFTLVATGIYAGIDLMPIAADAGRVIGRVIRTVGVVVWIAFFIRLATYTLKRLADLSYKHTFIQHRTLTLFDNAAKVFIFGLGIYAVFVIWNIDMTAWLASAGIAGIAIGFAAKDTLSNLFAGVFILADAPYKVGDYVVLDGGDRGKVMNIGLRSTRILTRDDVEITIPNSIIGNSTIVNQSGGPHPKMRLRVKIGVAYGSDIDQVRGLLMEIARKNSIVCALPEPRVRFRTFGASSLDFELLCWIDDPELRGQAMDLLNEAIYKTFAENSVEIPYAKQDIFIKEWPKNVPTPRPESAEEARGQGNSDG